MTLQDKITVLMDACVQSILGLTSEVTGVLTPDEEQDLRTQFDATIAFYNGSITNGDFKSIIAHHTLS